MRKYVAGPLLLGAAFAILYGVIGIAASIFKLFDWVEELQFHIVGIHFEGFAVFAVSVALLVVAVAAMLYVTGGRERPA